MFQILHTLDFDNKFLDSCINTMKKLVSIENFHLIYKLGCLLFHEKLKNVSLLYILFAIKEIKKSQFFFDISGEDCIKLFSSTMLNVTREYDVVELIVSWLNHQKLPVKQMENIAKELFGCVRWRNVSKIELDHLLTTKLVIENGNLQQYLLNHPKDLGTQDKRE